MRVIKYNSTEYNFVSVVSSIFGGIDLSDIQEEHDELFKVGADSKTTYHDVFYNKYRNGWSDMSDLYDKFIYDVVAPLYSEDFLYQSQPTFRVHLKNNIAVGAFHTDSEFNHPDGEINYIIPLTNSKDTASVWVESSPGKNDFSPIILRVGELIEFNGNKLRHGNKVNLTNKVRVSMDFRILPASSYNEDVVAESITRHTKFKEGEYYKRLVK